jgi:hypothetical protein
MSDFLLYGIDAAGETLFSEVLQAHDRAALREIAGERLRQYHAVEVWEGPMCVLRLQRTAAE